MRQASVHSHSTGNKELMDKTFQLGQKEKPTEDTLLHRGKAKQGLPASGKCLGHPPAIAAGTKK